MHHDYRDSKILELRDQLTRFAPKNRKVSQAEAAEVLLAEIEDDRQYALDYVCFRVTDYRPEKPTRHNIQAADLRHDLRLLIEDLSESAELSLADFDEKVYSVKELSQMFCVSTKTIGRWRESGLVARRIYDGPRRRVVFTKASVDRFAANNQQKVQRGARFSQLSADERSEVIERARRMAESGAIMSEVVRELATRLDRSPETIRSVLKNFDADNRLLSIFPNQPGTLGQDERRAIHRLHSQGVPVVQLCQRFKRTQSSIHRVLLEMRVETINELPLDYIFNEDFDDPKNEQEFLADAPEAPDKTTDTQKPAGLPSYLEALYEVPLLTREQEMHLFRKMNYLKHRATRLRESLVNARGKRASVMDQIEDMYEAAVRVKNKIVQSNLRLVVSIAKRHVSSNEDLFGLISDGNMSLIRAVEKFDYGRGNRFSTYASWSIIRNFARSIPNEYKHRDRFRTTQEAMVFDQLDDRLNPYLEESQHRARQRELSRIMDQLNEREQKIICARFGLGTDKRSLTLKEVGEEIGCTKERVRQLEIRALQKLRAAAAAESIDLDLQA
ncbi:MAG: sigma-70 family RNA polymerase sigma factor [Planctomycetota bacterium]